MVLLTRQQQADYDAGKSAGTAAAHADADVSAPPAQSRKWFAEGWNAGVTHVREHERREDEQWSRPHRTAAMGTLTDAQVEQVVTFDLGWYTSDGDAAAEHYQVREVADGWADPDCDVLYAEWMDLGHMPRAWLDECITGWFGDAEAWLLNGRPLRNPVT